MSGEMKAEFKAALLTWLRREHPDATELVLVQPHGTDYAGSTEEGFWEVFGVDIQWRDSAGSLRFDDINGTRMADLWRYLLHDEPTTGDSP